LGKIEDLDRLFTKDCCIRLEEPGRTVRTRSNLAALLNTAFRAVRDIRIRFHDIHISVGPDKETAETVLTATAKGFEFEGIQAKEIVLEWVKKEGEWLICSANERSPFR